MSALGQKQTCAAQNVMSALPPKGLFDHLIGALLHLQRHIEAQSLRGLEVDHQLVLGRRLHWQVTRLLAFESPVQPDSGPPTLLNCAKDSVRYR